MKSKKRLKRFLAVVMTMIMVLSMSGISAFASTTEVSGDTTTITYDSSEQATNGGIISEATTVDSGNTTKVVTKYNNGTMVTVDYTYSGSDVIKTKTTTQVYTDTTFGTLSAQTIVTVDESATDTTVTTTQEYEVTGGTATLSTTTTVTVVTNTSAGTVTTTTEVTSGNTGTFVSKTVEVVNTSTTNKVITSTKTYDSSDNVTTTVVEEVTYEYNGTTLERTTTVTTTYNGNTTGTVTSTVTEISGVKGSSAATYTLTIDNDVSGYVYTAYQVFKGDLYDVYTSLTSAQAAVYTGQLYTYDSGTFSNATYDADAAAAGTVYYSKTSTLSNIEWGDNISDITSYGSYSNIYEELATITDSSGNYPFTVNKTQSGDKLTTAAAVAAVLTDYNNDDTVLQQFAEIVSHYLTGSGTTSTDSGSGYYTISGLAPGYYFVSSTTVPANASASRYMLTVVSNQEIESKTDKSTVEKEVDLVSASIGDTVTYTLTATLPSNYADYDDYTLIFHDTLSDGLTYTDNSVTVTVYDYVLQSSLSSFTQGTTYYTLSNGVYTEVADTSGNPQSGVDYYTFEGTVAAYGYYVYTPGYTKVSVTDSEFNNNSSSLYYTYNTTTGEYSLAGSTYDSDAQYYTQNEAGTLEVRIDDTNDLGVSAKGDINVSSSSLIVVTYEATINENAVIGNGTNTEGYGNTNAVTLEYSNNPNSGGEGQTGTTTTQLVTTFTFELDVTKTDTGSNALEGAEFVLYKVVGTDKYYAVLDSDGKVSRWTTDDSQATTITSDSNGNFSIIGLGEGTYYLEETKAPAGYNLLSEALKIVITAEYDSNNSSVTGLSATVTTTSTSANWTGVVATGAISGSVQNSSGSVIPTTGGMGTTILYIIGAILVIGAAVILVTRRRMANK